jgi:hypothetical protein
LVSFPAAGSELISLYPHRGAIFGAPDDCALDYESQTHAIIQANRPLDESLDGLPWKKGFRRGKKKIGAADIKAFAVYKLAPGRMRFNAATFDCEM